MDTSFLRKKVAGVPVLYIAALFVAVLALVAYRMRPAEPTEGDIDNGTDESDVAGDPATADYSNLATQGTVTVQQGTDPATVTPIEAKTNENWAVKAANWLVAQGLASGTVAQSATRKYIAGESLSVTEGKLIDAAVKQYGVPPEPLTAGGVASPPASFARKQGTPPTTHTVEGKNDNDFWKLAKLYYGSDHYDYVNTLEVANLSIPKGKSHMPVGTRIRIPKYAAPKYYLTAGNNQTAQSIAGKNGTSAAAIMELNDSLKFPIPRKGTRVRVR